jgi:hypothetical protein
VTSFAAVHEVGLWHIATNLTESLGLQIPATLVATADEVIE